MIGFFRTTHPWREKARIMEEPSATLTGALVEERELSLAHREWRLEVGRTIREYVRGLSSEDVRRCKADLTQFDEGLQQRFQERGLVPHP